MALLSDLKLNILLLSPEDWGPCWVSKHHYANQLAKLGHSVYFVGPERYDWQGELPPGVHLLKAPASPRGQACLPSALRRRLHRKAGQWFMEEAGVSFDLVWSFDSSRFYELDCLGGANSYSIFHMVDFVDRLQWKKAARSADLCLACTKQIIQRLSSVADNCHFLNHGYSAFQELKYEFTGDGPHAVFAGNVSSSSVDKQRVMGLIARYPHVSFHFFGDTGKENLGSGSRVEPPFVAQLRSGPNVTLHGPVSPTMLPGIYAAADVLLLFYDPIHGETHTNAHKAMEYLGSGKPILSTVLKEYLPFPGLITMENDPERFYQTFQATLDEQDPELRARRKAFAEENRYENHITRVSQLLSDVGLGSGKPRKPKV